MKIVICVVAAAVVCAIAGSGYSEEKTGSISVDPAAVKCAASPSLWGIFFEDIDLSLDGGVYAELVRNRSFEDGHGNERDGIAYWQGEDGNGRNHPGRAKISLDSSRPLSEKNKYALKMVAGPGAGVSNEGYFGINQRAGWEK